MPHKISHFTLIFRVLQRTPNDDSFRSKHVALKDILKYRVRWNSVFSWDRLDAREWIPLNYFLCTVVTKEAPSLVTKTSKK